MMSTTMQEQAQETIQTNIVKYSLMLCQALEDNFKSRNRGETIAKLSMSLETLSLLTLMTRITFNS